MKMLKKILLATDFGEASMAAARAAAGLASVFGSEVLPLHVLRDLPELPGGEGAGEVRLAVDREFRKLAAEFERRSVALMPPVVSHGASFLTILDQANSQDVNLIVIGAGEHAPEGRSGLGSTAERVVRRSSKPVWVARPGAGDAIKRVVCAVDFSSHARRALTNGIHLARKFNAELVVLTVIEPLAEMILSGAAPPAKALAAYAESIQDRFQRLLEGHDLHGIMVEEKVGHGPPAEEIRRVAIASKADLLVMGSAGRSGISRFFLGSVANTVLRTTPCSVLTVKAEDAIRVEFEAKVDEFESRFDRGRELLESGCAEEAVVEFEALRTENPMAAPVWEGLAVAHLRLGHAKQAALCASRAEYLRNSFWKQMVESDIRRKHPLFEKD